jgi:thioredoxin-related protein
MLHAFLALFLAIVPPALATPDAAPASGAESAAGPAADSIETSEAADTDSPIDWMSYEKGVARGKENRKKIFLNFYADWCQYCKVMDQKTFTDESVVAYLNENFIPVRVDSDKEKKVARDYNVQALPVSWFIAEDGENIGSQPGYVPPDMMLPLLKYIHTDSYKEMDFQKFMDGM